MHIVCKSSGHSIQAAICKILYKMQQKTLGCTVLQENYDENYTGNQLITISDDFRDLHAGVSGLDFSIWYELSNV